MIHEEYFKFIFQGTVIYVLVGKLSETDSLSNMLVYGNKYGVRSIVVEPKNDDCLDILRSNEVVTLGDHIDE